MKLLTNWFNPYNRQHLRAYHHLRETGTWPDGFPPDDVEIPLMWHYGLANKMADLWVDEKLAQWEKVNERNTESYT